MSSKKLLEELIVNSKKKNPVWTDEAVEKIAIAYAKQAADRAYKEGSINAFVLEEDDELGEVLSEFDDYWSTWRKS